MNFIISLVKFMREKKNLKCKVEWTKPSYWKQYNFLFCPTKGLLVCFKDKNERCGNFFYAYPNINLQLTFFASKGCLHNESEFVKISKVKWLRLFLKNY